MACSSSVAGPSRLPAFLHRHPSVALCTTHRRASNVSATREPRMPTTLTRPPWLNPLAVQEKEASTERKRFQDTVHAFWQWMDTEGKAWKYVGAGEKAKWMGGVVPFPTNPSFRPPPPLSNDMQDRIYTDLLKGDKPIGALAVEYSVSKGRIEAIKKLKEVEAEMRRQDLTLQQAFQSGMETLLGTPSVRDRRTDRFSERQAIDERDTRAAHISSVAELDEEQRHDSGIGQTGAFSSRGQNPSLLRSKGLERPVWEWRSEDEFLAALKVDAADHQLAGTNREASTETLEKLAEVSATPAMEVAFPTPETEQARKQLLWHEQMQETDDASKKSAEQSTTWKAQSTKPTQYRFVDVSGTSKGVSQGYRVGKKLKIREVAQVKAKQRKEVMRRLLQRDTSVAERLIKEQLTHDSN